VTLRAVISETGELRSIEVLKGDPELVPAAKQAVRKWRYTPCLLNGKVREPITTIDVPFTLRQ
jgi:TonB family protein